MRLWIDDVRPAPEGYDRIYSVNDAIEKIRLNEILIKNLTSYKEKHYIGGNHKACNSCDKMIKQLSIELIDIDHDAGDYVSDGGDYIKLLDWLEETGRNYPIRIHSMNPVGVANMRVIIERNGWKEVR
jgi:hypothetical protein